MKAIKTIILLAACLAFTASYADELTAGQLKFRGNIMQFLKEEGFSPTIDESDNSVNFKKEGELHWITLDGDSPYFIEFHRSGFKCTDADMSKVLAAVNEGNRKIRSAKAYYSKGSISLAVEMFCHSTEEFRYVFYKNMEVLEAIENTVSESYNGTTTTSAIPANAYATSSLMAKFFPIYGLTIGKSTYADASSAGFPVKLSSNGTTYYSSVNDLAFWDHNHDKVFERIYFTKYDKMPAKWLEAGLSWDMSYNKAIGYFKSMGLSIEIDKAPIVKKYSGRSTLSAEVTAISADGHLKFELNFDYGNDEGEGYSLDSPNTLYSIRIDAK